MNYETHIRQTNRLPPEVVAELQPFFLERIWVDEVPVKIIPAKYWLGKYSLGGSPEIYAPFNQVWIKEGALSKSYLSLTSPGGLSIMAHELFHVYQYHRLGKWKQLKMLMTYLVTSWKVWVTQKSWHAVAEFEQEAMEFQQEVLEELKS